MNIITRFKSLPRNTQRLLGLGGVLGLTIALPLFIWAVITQNFNPKEKAGGESRVSVSTDGAPYIGPLNAPIIILEFGDFQCSFCKLFHDQTLQPLLEAYPDQVRFVYRNFPLVQAHPQAEIAAEAALCANEQNKYWQMSDLLFANQDNLESDDLKSYALSLGLNATQFNTCLDTSKYSQVIQQDIADGTSYGVTGTPSFFINGIPLTGAYPLSTFQEIIEQELHPSPSPSPAPVNNSVSWITPYVSLTSSNFYMYIDGNKLFVGNPDISVHSDPGDDTYTSLELAWQENGVNIGMTFYFSMVNNTWRVSEVRTGDGSTPGTVIYYNGFDGAQKGTPLTLDNFNLASNDGRGTIHFSNLILQPFLPINIPPSQYGYLLEPKPLTSNIVMTYPSSGMTSYGVNVVLRNSDFNIVTNQSEINYQWLSSNSNIVNVVPSTLPNGTGCAYGILPPCPSNHGDITATGVGSATITVNATNRVTGNTLASTVFHIIVNGTATPTVSPTPTVTPTPVPGTPNSCQGTCGSNYNCNGGLFCFEGFCRNPECPSDSSCGCIASPTPKPTKKPTTKPSPTSNVIYLTPRPTSTPTTVGVGFTKITTTPTPPVAVQTGQGLGYLLWISASTLTAAIVLILLAL